MREECGTDLKCMHKQIGRKFSCRKSQISFFKLARLSRRTLGSFKKDARAHVTLFAQFGPLLAGVWCFFNVFVVGVIWTLNGLESLKIVC